MILPRIIAPPTCVILWGSAPNPEVFKAFGNTGKAKEKASCYPGFSVYSPQIFLLKLCFHSARVRFFEALYYTTRDSEYQATTRTGIFLSDLMHSKLLSD